MFVAALRQSGTRGLDGLITRREAEAAMVESAIPAEPATPVSIDTTGAGTV